jgi:UrcA family protein
MTRKTLSLIAASIASATIATAAFAADTDEPPSVRVCYADLNLSSGAGVAHLYARLRNAANQVCEAHRVAASPTRLAPRWHSMTR